MRSITARLALLFFAVTLIVIAMIYVGVTARLDASVRDEKLGTLAELSRRYSAPVQEALKRSDDQPVLDRRVRAAADGSGARVTLFDVWRGAQGVRTSPRSDSAAQSDLSDLEFAVALTAARSGRPARGTEAGASGRVAEAALPLRQRAVGQTRAGVYHVIVYSSPVEDVDAIVGLIRRRVLLAGIAGLLGSLLGGYLVARALSRRVRRMERAARSVARGDFSARFESGARDELGQLARTLDRMQRQLAELEQARRRFIATASHELRTPVFSLSGFLELLEDEELDEETRRQFVRQLRRQADRLGKLATDLLDLSRLGAGSLELRPERVDLAELARTVAREFEPALGAHRSRLELELASGPVQAVCDPERVGQIMRILIDNAIAHTPPGTDVAIGATRANGRARVVVTDYGTGIKRASLERIFEPFFTSDGVQGSGLGLTIAHELAERMGGDLRAESVPGRTAFALELPA